ncbi:addiction module antidote protein [Roseomonas sp. 18066]|uniref:addiction module antidote protein n=1 Tax=Roseomonas sp. 18066 TaxID=2681412 RepID=UPI00135830CE|nr:addiction module antidote protein [Roseomonas sp. 18066]
MATETIAFDAAELLDTPEAQAAYLSEIMAEGDAAAMAEAIGTIARARGMTVIAREAGVSRVSLYRTLSGKGNPELATITKVLAAMGLRLSVTPTSA